jgi:hypothetical protein
LSTLRQTTARLCSDCVFDQLLLNWHQLRRILESMESSKVMEERKIDRSTLSRAFDELSKEISRAGERSAEIRLFGGTAMMLQFPEREATLDVDCVVTSGHGAVMRAMPVVARRLGLPSRWLNEGVSVYRSRSETDDDFAEMFALPGRRPVLRVLAARPQYLMAMKISALGRGAARDRSASRLRPGAWRRPLSVKFRRAIGGTSATAPRSLMPRRFPVC